MAYYSKAVYPADGLSTVYTVPFRYLDKSQVHVLLGESYTSAFTWLSPTQIQFTVAPAAGTKITIYRDTPKEEKLVNFTNGGALVQSDLDEANDQVMFIAQEAFDAATEATGLVEGTVLIPGPPGEPGAPGEQGIQGPAGPSPVVAMSGDQLTINGVVTGPHLTGPGGAAAGIDYTQGLGAINAAVAMSGTYYGKVYLCTANSADYTVTLPSATGNSGKLLEIIIAPSTYAVTIDAGAGSTINGSRTRVMCSGDTAILATDGTNWYKVGGRSLPLVASSTIPAQQDIPAATATVMNFNSMTNNTGPTAMVDTANKKLVCIRPGRYRLVLKANTNSGAPTNGAGSYIYISKNGTCITNVSPNFSYATTTSTVQLQKVQTIIANLAAGDYIQGVFYNTAAWSNCFNYSSCELSMEELAPW